MPQINANTPIASTTTGSFTQNWSVQFKRSDAGQRTAVLYSIVVSCQRHGVAPHAYLRDVLTQLPALTSTRCRPATGESPDQRPDCETKNDIP